MSPPLVSVVIAAHNAASYLAETLASATAQTWPNLEIILVDDGSTDDTAGVAATFAPRVRYEPRKHGGLAAARNEGIRLARGDYIALLDADDLWHPDKIAIQVAVAERHPQSGLIACDGEEFEGDRILQPFLFHGAATAVGSAPDGQMTGDLQRALIGSQLIACPAQTLLPRHVIDRIGWFIDSDAQDYDYYLRVSLYYPVTLHAGVLTRWRYRPGSMSGPRLDRKLRWGFDALPVLVAHRRRCRTEDRRMLDRRIRRQVFSLGKLLMRRGRSTTDRGAATGALVKLLSAHPWQPTLLVHLLGLWVPGPLYRIADRSPRRAER